jgi:N-acetyl-beta-hexosaminidase
MAPGLDRAAAGHILGVQAQLWTETCPTESACDAKLWPRMLAAAEIGWTRSDQCDWRDFSCRLADGQYVRLARAIGADEKELMQRGKIGAP